jgi:hypothetical protein
MSAEEDINKSRSKWCRLKETTSQETKTTRQKETNHKRTNKQTTKKETKNGSKDQPGELRTTPEQNVHDAHGYFSNSHGANPL